MSVMNEIGKTLKTPEQVLQEKTMLKNNIKKITQYNYFISKEEVEKATGKKGKSEKGTMVVFKQNGELKELNIADYKKLELKQ